NIQYLEDYWRFDAVDVASGIRETVQAEVAAAPGLLLSDLFRKTQGMASRDDVYRVIATGDVFVDLRTDPCYEARKVPCLSESGDCLGIPAYRGLRVSWRASTVCAVRCGCIDHVGRQDLNDREFR